MRQDPMTDLAPDADERQLSDYLLGRLRPEEESALEERYLADAAFHDQLRGVERDLIDLYVRGELPDAAAFERRYLSSPARRARVDFARALLHSNRPTGVDGGRSAAAPASPARRLPEWWPLAATVAIVVAGSLFVVAQWPRGAGNPPATGGSPTATGQPSPPPVEPPPSTPPPPRTGPTVIATLVLLPVATRGSDPAPTLNLDAASDVRLQLVLESGRYASYRVVVRTAEGRDVWRDDGLREGPSASGQSVATTIPAARLADDDYIVRLEGMTGGGAAEELSGYAFRIRR
jgi:hypothetical protein